jgi:hypothetical protein
MNETLLWILLLLGQCVRIRIDVLVRYIRRRK